LLEEVKAVPDLGAAMSHPGFGWHGSDLKGGSIVVILSVAEDARRRQFVSSRAESPTDEE